MVRPDQYVVHPLSVDAHDELIDPSAEGYSPRLSGLDVLGRPFLCGLIGMPGPLASLVFHVCWKPRGDTPCRSSDSESSAQVMMSAESSNERKL